MKRNLLFLLMALLPVVASAFDAEVNGIYYNLSGDDAVVTYMEYDPLGATFTPGYKGNVSLPTSVSYDGKTYSVTKIGNYAFAECKNLTSVTIPETVTSIGEGAFSECSGLTSVTIPGSVKSIGRNAFLECGSLTAVTLSDGVMSIGNGAFEDCICLTSITIPSSVTSMEDNAFSGCKSLTEAIIPGSVTNISKSAFNGCSCLTSLTIEDGVKNVGDGAFYGCSIASVTLPASVTKIGSGAFSGCSSLVSVTVPENVTSVGVEAFSGTPWLDSLPDGLVYIGKVAYRYKGELPEGTEFTIKEGTVQIVEKAFYDRGGLAAISIPNSVTSIGPNAFSGCSGLTTVTIPESLNSISEGVFGRCSSLTSVTIPNSVTSIGDNSFCNCTNLTSVNIGCSVKSIGKNAFSYCRSLTSITIPENVTNIGGWAFIYCSGLSSVTLSNGVASIDRSAFYGCTGLTSICIPESVNSIGRAAFAECTGLKDVFCLAENVPSTESNAFNKSPISLATLHVPADAVEEYRKRRPWNGFGSIVALPVVTYTENQMATIILPTAPDTEWGKYYRLDRCEDGQIIFEQELHPQAHIPYIIVPSEDFSIDTSTLDLAGLSNDTVSIGGISFIGSYDSETLKEPEGSYIDIIDTTPDCGFASLEETGKVAHIGALRAYLQVSWDEPYNHGGSKGPMDKMEIVLKDNPNAIGQVANDKLSNGKCFDLSGRQLSRKPAHGIYIKDGKKIIR